MAMPRSEVRLVTKGFREERRTMQRRPTIALVHKERNILASVALAFEAAGFQVRLYSDGTSAFEALSASPADIAILGRSMPGLYGPELFYRLRRLTRMPVIFLSSYGADLADEAPGAEDYLAVGCSHRILVERANAILHGGTGRLCIDPMHRVCTWQRQRLHLNMPEFLMLELLARGGVHTRFALMEAAYGAQIDMDEKVVDAHVASIERRFRGIDAAAKPIERISKVAYRLGKAV
jgi:two-component system, OmpR family, response regulator ChvI